MMARFTGSVIFTGLITLAGLWMVIDIAADQIKSLKRSRQLINVLYHSVYTEASVVENVITNVVATVENESMEENDDSGTLIQSNRSAEEEEGYMKKMEMRFAERKRRVQQQCHRLGGEMKSDLKQTFRKMFYSPKYDLIVCPNRKAGTTSMRKHLKDINKFRSVRQLLTWNFFTEDQVMARIQRPIRITHVRHPLERLVSAFRNKYRDGRPGLRKMEIREARRVFKDAKGKDFKLNFTQFLDLVAYEHLNMSRMLDNWHWETYYFACSYCDIEYDYFIKMETYKEDLAYVFERAGAIRNTSIVLRSTSADMEQSKRFGFYMEYFKDVPASTLHAIYQVFKYDLVMHDYQLPSDIESVLRTHGTKLL